MHVNSVPPWHELIQPILLKTIIHFLYILLSPCSILPIITNTTNPALQENQQTQQILNYRPFLINTVLRYHFISLLIMFTDKTIPLHHWVSMFTASSNIQIDIFLPKSQCKPRNKLTLSISMRYHHPVWANLDCQDVWYELFL